MDEGISDTPKQHKNNTDWQESVLIHTKQTTPNESDAKYTISYIDIISTGLSIILRAAAVGININLAYSYYQTDDINYFVLTSACIIIPMIITTLIHANMCLQDQSLDKENKHKVTWISSLQCFLFRYWNSLRYAIKCKKAQNRGDIETQKKYFKLTIREESDIAFIRIFECFLEAAPQKILQISIVLTLSDKMSTFQTIAICSYFGNIAWCLSTYHRCNRYAQIDKNNMKLASFVLQLCWHFCVSVSRTLCIAFVASLFPLWTFLGCLIQGVLSGILTFLYDQPKFCERPFGNILFCMVLGIVYLFTYIMPKDGRTRNKYIVYYTLNSLENIFCVALFITFAPDGLKSCLLFYPMCAITIAFYYVGIGFMIIYYKRFHPNILARSPTHILK